MSSDSPVAVLYDNRGVALAVSGGISVPVSTSAILNAGIDSDGIARYLRAAPAGELFVTGSFLTTDVTVAGTGSVAPFSGSLIGGVDGTTYRALSVDSNGKLNVNSTAVVAMNVYNAITASNFNLNAAPFVATSSIDTDYTLNHIECSFSTTSSRDILIKTNSSTVFYSASNDTSRNIILSDIELSFTSGSNFIISISQTGDPCIMQLLATVTKGYPFGSTAITVNQGLAGALSQSWYMTLADNHGVAMSVSSSVPVPVGTSALLVAGVDSNDVARTLLTDPRGNVRFAFGDTSAIDSFGRLRISNPITLINSKQVFDIVPQYLWSSSSLTGSSVTYTPNRASTIMSVTTTSGSFAARQTNQRANYQSGKSLEFMTSFIMNQGVSGIRKRIGYFDTSNGIYLEQSGTNINFCVRSALSGVISDTVVSQSSWNLDKLDGTGPSKVSLDFTKNQIFFGDIEWLGVGRVRLGFVIDGQVIYAHKFNFANSGNAVYMTNPNLPIRSEIKNIAGSLATGSLEQICSAVMIEGTSEVLGIDRAIDRGSTAIAVTKGNMTPAISIRLNPSYVGVSVIPTEFTIIADSSATFRWTLYARPTVAGVDAASWTSISGSAVQYDISRTTSNFVNGGFLLKSGYVKGGNGAANAIEKEFEFNIPLGFDINGNSFELILAVDTIVGNNSENYYASIGWRELL